LALASRLVALLKLSVQHDIEFEISIPFLYFYSERIWMNWDG
jgi:hypothetical protein